MKRRIKSKRKIEGKVENLTGFKGNEFTVLLLKENRKSSITGYGYSADVEGVFVLNTNVVRSRFQESQGICALNTKRVMGRNVVFLPGVDFKIMKVDLGFLRAKRNKLVKVYRLDDCCLDNVDKAYDEYCEVVGKGDDTNKIWNLFQGVVSSVCAVLEEFRKPVYF